VLAGEGLGKLKHRQMLPDRCSGASAPLAD
jgi:hypothetical protein